MTTALIAATIRELETYSKQGQSYTDKATGRFGWRNPIRSDTGDLLQTITISTAPRRILEIGTGHGLSTLYLASGLKDHDQDQVDTIEFDPEVAAATQERMTACKAPVRVLAGDALDVISTLSGRYDLVFFDAQKDKYLDHFLALLQRELVGKGSVILADNVKDRQEECQPFLDWFEKNDINSYTIQTACGLLVARL